MTDIDATDTDRLPEKVDVVVIDDHHGVREHLATVLSLHGFHVIATAGNCRDGREAVERHLPHVAIIDNRMPDGSGVDLCVELAESCPQVITVIHTGAITTTESGLAAAHGAAAIVMKSARPTRLIETVRHLTTQRRPG